MGSLPEVVGRTVERRRTARGFSLRDLSARLEDLGVRLGPMALSRIENAERGLDVTELLALAAALDVPPVLLLAPVHDGTDVPVTPTETVGAWQAVEWIVGRQALPSSDVGRWAAQSGVLRLYERLLDAQAAALSAGYRAASGPVLGGDEETLRGRYVEALEELATAVAEVERSGGDVADVLDPKLGQHIDEIGIRPRAPRVVRLDEEG